MLRCAEKQIIYDKFSILYKKVFIFIFETFRSRNTIVPLHVFVFQCHSQYTEYWSNNNTLLPQISSHFISPKLIYYGTHKIIPCSAYNKGTNRTIKRNNVHFYYILMISPLLIYVQPSGNILATGISRDSLFKLPFTKQVKRQLSIHYK